ncbi:hypothetical protein [Nostoc sp. NOS(2021)]|uniref:hypothetical protein n=1 Tax=Nostoc sp. NOS(2021) TaxID=2815407 RepID=UPI0025F28BD7|nr:hypothetical protein [Nostoc sp. NOS(2021)]
MPKAERKATIAHQITLVATFPNAISKRLVNSEERRLAKTAGIAMHPLRTG